MTQEIARDIVREAVKAAPPVTIWALTLNEWLAVASIAYILLQTAYLIRKWAREEKRRNGTGD